MTLNHSCKKFIFKINVNSTINRYIKTIYYLYKIKNNYIIDYFLDENNYL